MKFFEKICNFLGLYEEVEITEGEEAEREKGKNKKLEEARRPPAKKISGEDAPPWLTKPKPVAASGGSKVVSLPTTNKQIKVMLVAPKIFDDAQIIADHVKAGKPVVVNFEETDESVTKRIMDFIAGTVYALNGNIKMVGSKSRSMVCAPNNVDIDIDKEFSSGKDFGPWRQ